jgi:hypothetical protein
MSERRRAPRTRAGGWAARVRPGHTVHVVDVSASGALLEAARPLRPGSGVEVQFERSDHRVRLTATVVRCGVASLDPDRGPTYRAAIAFAETFDWVREATTHGGYGVPDSRDHVGQTRSRHTK